MTTANARQDVALDVLALVPEAIALLNSEERLEFWKFAAREVSTLRTPRGLFNAGHPYDGLCAAVQENERKAPPKTGVNGIPRTARRLSGDELQKAVARHREKLLVNTGAQRFLRDVFSRWVGAQKLEALVSILDAFGLEHDDVGILTASLREIASDEATKTMLALRKKHSSNELAVVSAGLMFNHSRWTPLATAYSELCEASRAEQAALAEMAVKSQVADAVPIGKTELTKTNQDAEVVRTDSAARTHLEAPELEFTPDALRILRESMNALARKLLNAASLLEGGTYVDDVDIRGHWRRVATELERACNFLGCRTERVLELEVALLEREQARSADKEARLAAGKAIRIFHVADASFVGCDEAKLFAEELLTDSSAALTQEIRYDALNALLKIVELPDVLSDDEAADFGEKIQKAFGRSLAAAALRGKLAIRPPQHTAIVPTSLNGLEAEVSSHQPETGVDVGTAVDSTTTANRNVVSVGPAEQVGDLPDGAVNSEARTFAPVEASAALESGPLADAAEASAGSWPSEVRKLDDGSEPDLSEGALPAESVVEAHAPTPFLNRYEVGAAFVEPLIAFSDFKRAYWIDSNGRVGPAPWRSGSFYEDLSRSALVAWRTGHFDLALLRASALADSEGVPTLRLVDLRAASRLLDDAADAAVARDRTRSEFIRAALENVPSDRTLALALTLEALCPTFPFVFSAGEVAKLISAASFTTPALATTIEYLLNGWSAAADPIDVLRSHIEHQGATDAVALQAALSATQKRLKSIIASLWSAAGGRLQRTHCRRAWTEFVDSQVAPVRDMLVPTSQATTSNWSVQAARQRAEELVKSFARIMDSAGVKHQDRVAAIGAAEQIIAAIEEVINAKQRLVRAPRLAAGTFGALPIDQAAQLLAELPSDPLDKLLSQLFRVVIRRQAEENPFVVSAGALVAFPDLAAWVSADLLASPQLTKGIPIASFTSLPAAVAILDSADAELRLHSPVERVQLIAEIRNAAVDADRSDILAALSPTDGLQANERTLLHRRALELGDRAYQQARRLEQAWAACDELLAPEAPRFRSLVDEALGVCSTNASETQVATSILLLHWLHEAVTATERARDEVAATRAGQAHERSEKVGTEFKRLVASGDYRGAMALLSPDSSPSEHATETPRRTLWRKTAMERYSQPRSALIKEIRGATKDQNLLISWWVQGDSNDSTYRDTLRRALYSVISGEAGRTQAENQRRFPIKLSELREHKDRRTVIYSSAIREYFKYAKLNPSFLPQLAEYPQIVLTSLLGSPQGGNSLDNYVKATSAEGQGALCVFLEPGIDVSRRDEIVSGLRRRGLAAAIVDDIDLCRLCVIGADAEAHNFIPFFEIVFEQLDLELVSPFSSQDGQHVKVETFIGRAAAAHRIATGWEFSRVFSGRKLGKSAFLRHVANAYDQSKCQSGNDLDVIFITIAGGESEAWIVNCIIDEMSQRFQLPSEQESSTRLSPADRFTRYIKRFADTRQNRNVLLILDEADAFVEGQLAAYDRDRESSLSFRMMKELLPQLIDSTGMPRVRVVFSGYRVTNTRGGVWANAGDVLILTPLTEEEASLFLQGMLGRIGVDIGSHAPFAARRCGFQPAVLIRFGDSLLKRIRRSPRSNRESYQVSYDDVVATMSDQAVLDEIKTVVNNNFQSNRIAAAIFGATLLALKDLEPGLALNDGPQHVLKKLVEIDPNLDWMGSIGTPQLAQVERQMQEFIDRELLTVSDAPRFGVREYRLKFPHFLPVLTQQTDISIDVRQHIQHLRVGGAAGQLIESVLSESSLDTARYWYRQDSVEFCSIVVAAGQWARGLLDGKAGLPDRLGCNQPNVGMSIGGDEVTTCVQGGMRVFGDVRAEEWERYVAQSPAKPIIAIGGVDLLRAARRHVLAGHDRPVDVLTLGPLSQATLTWWFQEVRALHFSSPGAFTQIWSVTGGLPFLVGQFDSLLRHPLAAEVSTADLDAAIAMFESGYSGYASALESGDAAIRLTTRELQLLRMAYIVAAEAQDEFDLEFDFAECWNVCPSGDLSEAASPMTETTDRLSIQMLIDVGFLQANVSASPKAISSLGRAFVNTKGAAARLVKALAPQRAS